MSLNSQMTFFFWSLSIESRSSSSSFTLILPSLSLPEASFLKFATLYSICVMVSVCNFPCFLSNSQILVRSCIISLFFALFNQFNSSITACFSLTWVLNCSTRRQYSERLKHAQNNQVHLHSCHLLVLLTDKSLESSNILNFVYSAIKPIWTAHIYLIIKVIGNLN